LSGFVRTATEYSYNACRWRAIEEGNEALQKTPPDAPEERLALTERIVFSYVANRLPPMFLVSDAKPGGVQLKAGEIEGDPAALPGR
jgi:hypothetical protein